MESWELVFVEFGANIKLDIGENNKHVLDIDVKNELVKKHIFLLSNISINWRHSSIYCEHLTSREDVLAKGLNIAHGIDIICNICYN